MKVFNHFPLLLNKFTEISLHSRVETRNHATYDDHNFNFPIQLYQITSNKGYYEIKKIIPNDLQFIFFEYHPISNPTISLLISIFFNKLKLYAPKRKKHLNSEDLISHLLAPNKNFYSIFCSHNKFIFDLLWWSTMWILQKREFFFLVFVEFL